MMYSCDWAASVVQNNITCLIFLPIATDSWHETLYFCEPKLLLASTRIDMFHSPGGATVVLYFTHGTR